jgi:hypothetical protein
MPYRNYSSLTNDKGSMSPHTMVGELSIFLEHRDVGGDHLISLIWGVNEGKSRNENKYRLAP